jgi:predicted phage replisome organizer
MSKVYYWLKLDKDFFKGKEIKKLRKIAGGDTYTIIYLKLQLLSLRDEGKLYFDGIEDSFAEELALELDEDVDNITFVLMYLKKYGLVQEVSDDEILLNVVPNLIGKETDKAELMRRKRRKEKELSGNDVTELLPDVKNGYTEKIKEERDKSNNKEVYIDLTFIDDSIDKVKLTQEQYDKLINKYGRYQLHKEILALDNYIVNGKGNKYKDHYRALNIWCGKNKEVSNNGIFRKNTTEGKKYNIKREEFDPNKYNATEGDMPV